MDHSHVVELINVDNIESFEYDIVVIDSGFNSLFKTKGISITKHKDKILISKKFKDEIGHGTAINSIINKEVPLSKIFNIKIYEGKKVNPDLLLYALKYVYDNIRCKIVNISLGINYYNNLTDLYKICS